MFKRIFYSGIGLAIVLLIFMVVPKWLRNVDHPLTALNTVDVCAYLSEAARATLPEPIKVERGFPGEKDTGQPVCHAVLGSSPRDASPPNVVVGVTTERMLTFEGRRQPVDRYVDTWLRESTASGSEVTPLKGPWRRAAVIREKARPANLSLLADDGGVAVLVTAQNVEYPVFVAFAETVTKGLRAKPPGKGGR